MWQVQYVLIAQNYAVWVPLSCFITIRCQASKCIHASSDNKTWNCQCLFLRVSMRVDVNMYVHPISFDCSVGSELPSTVFWLRIGYIVQCNSIAYVQNVYFCWLRIYCGSLKHLFLSLFSPNFFFLSNLKINHCRACFRFYRYWNIIRYI